MIKLITNGDDRGKCGCFEGESERGRQPSAFRPRFWLRSSSLSLPGFLHDVFNEFFDFHFEEPGNVIFPGLDEVDQRVLGGKSQQWRMR